jgi:hypothetical protein
MSPWGCSSDIVFGNMIERNDPINEVDSVRAKPGSLFAKSSVLSPYTTVATGFVELGVAAVCLSEDRLLRCLFLMLSACDVVCHGVLGRNVHFLVGTFP